MNEQKKPGRGKGYHAMTLTERAAAPIEVIHSINTIHF